MKTLLKNYKSSLILLISIILGTIIGLIFKEKVTVLKPLGDLFLNFLLVITIPLIFLTITSSIGKMRTPKRLSKVLGTIAVIIIITSFISVLIGILSAYTTKLVEVGDINNIKETLVSNIESSSKDINYLKRTVDTVSVNNFGKLLANENMIALIVFSILTGIAINMSKYKGKILLTVLDSANEVVQKFIKIIMHYAPIGLGCYFAALIGNFGGSLVLGYTKTFIIYIVTCVLFYFIVYSIYAYISSGKKGFIRYWRNIVPPTITALATCSSVASIPVNITASKNIGVPDDIADTAIPLGTSFHKDGSIIGSVFKIMFLVHLFSSSVSVWQVLGAALIATLLVSAVPMGGGTISEMLIITMLGFPINVLPILTIITTIIDAPSTVLNVVGNTASSMLVARVVDGGNWLKQKI